MNVNHVFMIRLNGCKMCSIAMPTVGYKLTSVLHLGGCKTEKLILEKT